MTIKIGDRVITPDYKKGVVIDTWRNGLNARVEVRIETGAHHYIDELYDSTENLKLAGFNPDTLEFDGVKIEAGDEVEINDHIKAKIWLDDFLYISWDSAQIPLEYMGANFTAHYPQKTELEKAREELKAMQDVIARFHSQSSDATTEEENRLWGCIAEAYKKLEGLNNK